MNDQVSRRGFFSTNWKASVGFMKNFLAPQLEQERNFFRPPGASEELPFLTSCSRCGKCKEVCPEQSIQLYTYNSGVKKAQTPYLNPNESPCTFCKKCIDVCPTGALSHEALEAYPAVGTAVLRPDVCLAYQGTLCDYCVRSCLIEGALKLVNFKPVVDEKKCVGCGVCVSRCIAENEGIYVRLPN